jgi:high-affinity iron transporter
MTLIVRGRLALLLLVLLPAVAVAAPPPAAEGPAAPSSAERAQRILHMLDYVGVDYAGAVKDGRVLEPGEYAEQLEFVTQARAMLAALPPHPEQPALLAQADRLVALVTDKRPPGEVASLATELRWAIIRAYKVEVAPRRPPDPPRGAALFAAQCAVCHGPEGRGDGPAGKSLDPRPSDFHDRERMTQRSVYGLYSTITLGVEGTAMASFRALPEDERWALAFHAAALGLPGSLVERGAALWKAGKGRDLFPDLASLTSRSARELEARHGPEAVALHAHLLRHPEAVAAAAPAGGAAAIATSERMLRESLDAYRQGRAREAQELAVAAYLDGFELAEPSLDAVDRALRVSVETEMLRYRGLVRDGAPLEAVAAQAAAVERLLDRAREALEIGGLPPGTAFASAFIILLREGLEALLVLAAMVALLVKAGRRDALPWVYGGCVVALALGGLTWVVASYAVGISGATREATEGMTALIAAGILLYVGFWMHGKSQTDRWQEYLTTRLAGALSRRTMWALGFVSFLAVYREVFETVLFYEALAAQAGPGGGLPLASGLAVAALALLAMGWGIVRGSLRLPLGFFFGASAVLLGILAVVFAGKGIAALQKAGMLPIHGVGLPAVPPLGVYPSLEGLCLQAALALVIVGGYAWMRKPL